MGVFKEEASTFEAIERNQTVIYNDAADFGYGYNTNNIPNVINELIESVNSFKELDEKFPEEIGFIRHRHSTENDVHLEIRIAWEIDEGYYMGTEYIIGFSKTPKHPSLINKSNNAFISVNSRSYKEPIKNETPKNRI